jgi:hypothetical protein
MTPRNATYIDKGKYQLGGLAPGEYRVVVNAPVVSENGGRAVTAVEVKERQQTLDIALAKRPAPGTPEQRAPGPR